MKTTISKRDWLNALVCRTHAWHKMRCAPSPPGEAALFRMKQGQEIGELARGLYPEGVFVSKNGEKTTVESQRRDSATSISWQLLLRNMQCPGLICLYPRMDPCAPVSFQGLPFDGPVIHYGDSCDDPNRLSFS